MDTSLSTHRTTPDLASAPRSARNLVADVIRRFRAADGTSHARALAYQSVLAVIAGFIAIVGISSLLHVREVRSVVQHIVSSVAPGPSGKLLQEAAAQGATNGTTAVVLGLAAALITGMFAVAQVERSADRIKGIDTDRPTARRYALAFVLAIPVGALLATGGLMIGAGAAIPDALGLAGAGAVAWDVVRWPLGLVIVGAGLLLLLRAAPLGRLGSTRHLMIGTAVALVLWVVFTGLLGVYFAVSSSASQTYGPLLSVVALMLWALLTSLALHLGIATTVELER
ncbi:MAG: YhjD/YihY/BrkB family envelope integrity protein [Actinomycetota bacterium]